MQASPSISFHTTRLHFRKICAEAMPARPDPPKVRSRPTVNVETVGEATATSIQRTQSPHRTQVRRGCTNPSFPECARHHSESTPPMGQRRPCTLRKPSKWKRTWLTCVGNTTPKSSSGASACAPLWLPETARQNGHPD